MKRSLLEFRSKHGVPAVGAAIVDANGNVVVDVVGTTRRRGLRGGDGRRCLAHRVVRQIDDRGAVRQVGRTRRRPLGEPAQRPPAGSGDAPGLEQRHDRRRPAPPRRRAGQPQPERARRRSAGSPARARPAHVRGRPGALTAAGAAGPVPLLQPRLHRRRRRCRADHRRDVRGRAHRARPRAARHHDGRIRPARTGARARRPGADHRCGRVGRRPRSAGRAHRSRVRQPARDGAGGTAAPDAERLGEVPAGVPRRWQLVPHGRERRAAAHSCHRSTAVPGDGLGTGRARWRLGRPAGVEHLLDGDGPHRRPPVAHGHGRVQRRPDVPPDPHGDVRRRGARPSRRIAPTCRSPRAG